jgi:hypothetical protein
MLKHGQGTRRHASADVASGWQRSTATPKPLGAYRRDAREHHPHRQRHRGCVGSDIAVAFYQELGTHRIPPRSFLVSSAILSEDKIHRMAAATTMAA